MKYDVTESGKIRVGALELSPDAFARAYKQAQQMRREAAAAVRAETVAKAEALKVEKQNGGLCYMAYAYKEFEAVLVRVCDIILNSAARLPIEIGATPEQSEKIEQHFDDVRRALSEIEISISSTIEADDALKKASRLERMTARGEM